MLLHEQIIHQAKKGSSAVTSLAFVTEYVLSHTPRLYGCLVICKSFFATRRDICSATRTMQALNLSFSEPSKQKRTATRLKLVNTWEVARIRSRSSHITSQPMRHSKKCMCPEENSIVSSSTGMEEPMQDTGIFLNMSSIKRK